MRAISDGFSDVSASDSAIALATSSSSLLSAGAEGKIEVKEKSKEWKSEPGWLDSFAGAGAGRIAGSVGRGVLVLARSPVQTAIK